MALEEKNKLVAELSANLEELRLDVARIEARKDREFSQLMSDKDLQISTTNKLMESLRAENMRLQARLNDSISANNRDTVLKLDFETN